MINNSAQNIVLRQVSILGFRLTLNSIIIISSDGTSVTVLSGANVGLYYRNCN